MFFFFFKQKTAYEMRISDWSSDVCSSDLRCVTLALHTRPEPSHANRPGCLRPHRRTHRVHFRRVRTAGRRRGRSEEHTSELQSLMRISYAVFCLKKKKQLTPT